MTRIKNQIGLRIGLLTVIVFEGFKTEKIGKSFPYWRCICDCGNTISLRSGLLSHKESCGCLSSIRRSGKDDEDKRRKINDYRQSLIEHREQILTQEQKEMIGKAESERSLLPEHPYLELGTEKGYSSLPSEISMLPCRETDTYYY